MQGRIEEDTWNQLHLVLSPQYFAQVTLQVFQNQVVYCLQHVISKSKRILNTSTNIQTSPSSSSSSSSSTQPQVRDVIERYDFQVIRLLFPFTDARNHVFTQSSMGGDGGTCRIQWEALVQNQNDVFLRSRRRNQKASKSSSGTSYTALGTILEALINDSVIPACCAEVIILGLLSMSVHVFSNQMHYSLLTLSCRRGRRQLNEKTSIRLDMDSSPWEMIQWSIVYLLEHRLSVSLGVFKTFLSSHMLDWNTWNNETIPFEEETLLQDHNLIKLQTVLHIAKKLFVAIKDKKSLRNHVSLVTILLHPILLMLKQVDQMDVHLLEKRQRIQATTRGKILCQKCRLHPSDDGKKRRSFTPTQSIASLHGEEEDPYDSLPRKRPRSSHGGRSYTIQDGEEPCPLCSNYLDNLSWRARQRGREITALPIRAVSLRGQMYRIILEFVDSCKDDDTAVSVFRLVMNLMTRYSTSSSIRLVTVLILHWLPALKDGVWLTRGISELLSKGTSNIFVTFDSEAILKAYSELVVECSFFDDSVVCWNAIRPMVDVLFSLNEKLTVLRSHEHDNNHSRVSNVERNTDSHLSHERTCVLTQRKIRLILQCLGYMFVNRHGLLTDMGSSSGAEIHDSFKWYIVQCSEAFGERKFWISSSMNTLQQKQLVCVLQLVGILSFIDIDNNIDVQDSKQVKGCWPFPCFSSIRSTHERMGVKDQRQRILSFNHTIDIPTATMCDKRHSRNRENSISDAPILDYLNDDLTRQIFSYLGYKKMVRVTSVCKLWNVIGNESHFWKGFYMRRFKTIFLEELLHHSTKENVKNTFVHNHGFSKTYEWRKVFDAKWKKERILRSSFGKEGWKRRTCAVVGCLTIISSKSHHERHCQMHRRDVERKCKVIQGKLERESKKKLKSKHITSNVQRHKKVKSKPSRQLTDHTSKNLSR